MEKTINNESIVVADSINGIKTVLTKRDNRLHIREYTTGAVITSGNNLLLASFIKPSYVWQSKVLETIRTNMSPMSDPIEYIKNAINGMTKLNPPESFETIKLDKNAHFALCAKCDTYHIGSWVYVYEGENICTDCLSDHELVICEHCKEPVPEDESTKIDGCDYCDSCVDEHFRLCDDCGEYGPLDGMRYLDHSDTYICDDCIDQYTYCDVCNEYYPSDCIVRVDGLDICDGCAEDRVYTCERCEGLMLDNHACTQSDGEVICYDCNDRRNRVIHNYSYSPKPIFHTGEGEEIQKFNVGIELETATKKTGNPAVPMAEKVLKVLPEIYCKSDCSVTDRQQDPEVVDGFEIVTHPISWQGVLERKERFELMLKTLVDNNYLSYNTKTCGMHVHISKEAFEPDHLYKFMKLFYENPAFISKISQRTPANLKRWATIEFDNSSSLVYKAKKKDGGSRRYVAINMQHDAPTVEVRIFRGTLSKKSFFKNLEFCRAVYCYTNQESVFKITVPRFIEYITVRNREYPNLVNFIESKNIQSTSKELTVR